MDINLSNGCTVGLQPRFNVAMLFDERIQPFLADIYIKTEFRSQLQLVLGGQHGRGEVNIFEGERSPTIRVSKELCEDVLLL